MKMATRYIWLAILLLLWQLIAFAQVNFRASVDREKILIGETIVLTLEAYMPLGSDIQWFRADSIPAFEILNLSKLDTMENIDGKKLAQVLSITSFDSGLQYVPPFEILVNNQPFYTDSIGINVSFTPFDPDADYRDIKDIIEVHNPDVKYIPWALAIAAVLSLAIMLILLLRKRKVSNVVSLPAKPALSPYDEAVLALSSLMKTKPADADVKGYYSELNDILRNYLSREFRIATFERTNDELIVQLSRLDISKDALFSLAQSLRMIDFVKFAKYRPPETENEKNISTVKKSIDILNKTVVSAV